MPLPSSSFLLFRKRRKEERRRKEEGGGSEYDRFSTGEGEQARVEDALWHIPADEYDTWLRVGMALHEW